MTDPSHDDLTEWLRKFSLNGDAGDPRLLAFLYRELRRLAAAAMRRERAGHTLEPTALVNEVFLRLFQDAKVELNDRAHFFAVAAQVMRRVLVDYARARNSDRRGGGLAKVPLDDNLRLTGKDMDNILAVNGALDELKQVNERYARIVELRFFGGLTEEEIAGLLDLSSRTVKRDWTAARAWLHARLAGSKSDA